MAPKDPRYEINFFMRCATACLGTSLNITTIEKALKRSKTAVMRIADVLHVNLSALNRDIFYFTNGTIVYWNINKREFIDFLKTIREYCTQPLINPHIDDYLFRYSDSTTMKPHVYFQVDVITLENDDADLKLALSYALSRSIKIKMYEQKIDQLVMMYSPLISQLAIKGKIKLGRREIYHIIGNILEAKSLVNLQSNYAYLPKFFWQHPNLESAYVLLERYLDINVRVSALNQQLDTLNEIFLMLNGHLENQHSHFLEIIIIALIVIEIVFNILHL